MALPNDESEWLQYLELRHDAEIPELEALNRYYEGTQPLTYMHPEVLAEVRDRIKPVIIAWPQLVVDAIEERLDAEGFRLPDEDEQDDDLWRVWQSSDMDEQTQLANIDALVMKRSYITVGTNEDDPDTPLMSAESPLEMYADVDPRTRRVRAALRRVVDDDVYGRVSTRQAGLYLPDRTVWYEYGSNGWVEIDRDEHGLGAVPVVPIVNRARLSSERSTGARGRTDARYGRSELAPILPLSDAANKLATDMMVAAEGVALPLRGLFGIGPDDLEDQDGNKLTAVQALMRKLLTIPVGTDEGVKEFEFKGADLSGFHSSINQLAQMVATLAGLPPHYVGIAADNPASADAIRSAESRLVKRAERKQRAWGGGYEQSCRIVRRLQTGEWDPRLQRLETVWRDASTPTVAQAADAAVKKYTTTPRPIVTLRQTREDLGYTDAQIDRMEAEDEREAARDPVGALARGLTERDSAGAEAADGDSA